jgi:chromosome segregation ATPase
MEGCLSCATCASKGITCVKSSWTSLDKTRKEIKEKLEADLNELAELANAQQKLLARIGRHRKTLKLAEARARAKTICLLDELEE